MRITSTVAALAAIAAIATAATATPMHHRHAAKADNGAAAVRALNEKSLQQASAAAPMMATPGQAPAMSDSGAMAAPAAPAPAPSTPQ